jgi:hypothetical protein
MFDGFGSRFLYAHVWHRRGRIGRGRRRRSLRQGRQRKATGKCGSQGKRTIVFHQKILFAPAPSPDTEEQGDWRGRPRVENKATARRFVTED